MQHRTTLSEAQALRILDEAKRRLQPYTIHPVLGRIELLKEDVLRREKPDLLDQETRRWLVTQLKLVVEMGLEKIGTKSTGKAEKIRWANTIANVANVLRATLADFQLHEINRTIDETIQSIKTGRISRPPLPPKKPRFLNEQAQK